MNYQWVGMKWEGVQELEGGIGFHTLSRLLMQIYMFADRRGYRVRLELGRSESSWIKLEPRNAMEHPRAR
jgi:hypothetical protein